MPKAASSRPACCTRTFACTAAMAGLHWRCRAVLHPTGLLVLALALAVLHQPAWSSQDHYRTLGITKAADAAAIRGAYKRLALKLHPDKLGGKPKEHQRQQFLRIQVRRCLCLLKLGHLDCSTAGWS